MARVFETTRQRGRFLVAVFAVFVLSGVLTDRWASHRADALARSTRADLARLLADATFPEFALKAERAAAGIPPASSARIDPVTGDVQVATPLAVGWQRRCVEGHRTGSGQVTTRLRQGPCRPIALHS